MTAPRFPVEPVVDYLWRHWPQLSENAGGRTISRFSYLDDTPLAPVTRECDLVGLEPWRWVRWKRRGSLSVKEADYITTQLGVYPTEIWPDW